MDRGWAMLRWGCDEGAGKGWPTAAGIGRNEEAVNSINWNM
ncbi:hypothetical protein ACP4OV_011423 [Aristida adscensionis]